MGNDCQSCGDIKINPITALFGSIAALGVFFIYDVQQQIRLRDARDHTYSAYKQRVDSTKNPESRDVNNDGKSDLVLKLNSGEDLVLYGVDGRYQYREPE